MICIGIYELPPRLTGAGVCVTAGPTVRDTDVWLPLMDCEFDTVDSTGLFGRSEGGTRADAVLW